MRKALLLAVALALGGCETFRVVEPQPIPCNPDPTLMAPPVGAEPLPDRALEFQEIINFWTIDRGRLRKMALDYASLQDWVRTQCR